MPNKVPARRPLRRRKPARCGSSVLLLVFGVALAGLLYDYTIARPAIQKADQTIQGLLEGTIKDPNNDGGVTEAEVQDLLGRQPSTRHATGKRQDRGLQLAQRTALSHVRSVRRVFRTETASAAFGHHQRRAEGRPTAREHVGSPEEVDRGGTSRASCRVNPRERAGQEQVRRE